MPRDEPRDMERDHWIEILRSTGVHKPANPAFTMSEIRDQESGIGTIPTLFPILLCSSIEMHDATWLAEPQLADARPAFALRATTRQPSSLRERRLVEPIGIEPTTSSLQSSRSPN